MPDLQQSAAAVRAAIRDATTGLVERETLADLIVLSAIAGEHLLVIGPPGTAKSAVVRRVASALGGSYFEYLLGRFTEPSEVFGAVDLKKLREGRVETVTGGMLPEAEIAFLDEVFLGSTAILNTLLGILNERRFRRGQTELHCPLRVCVGASNALPEDHALNAFADRFLVHLFLEPVSDLLLEDLLASGHAAATASPSADPQRGRTVSHLDHLAEAARQVQLDGVRPHLAHCIRLLRKAGIHLSDRRLVKAQGLMAAAATVAGRTSATRADLWPLIYVVPTATAQAVAREVLREELEASANAILPAAAEEASCGPAARATRLLEAGEQLLAQPPSEAEELGRWLLALEAVVKEMDATIPEHYLTEPLYTLRSRVVEQLAGEEPGAA